MLLNSQEVWGMLSGSTAGGFLYQECHLFWRMGDKILIKNNNMKCMDKKIVIVLICTVDQTASVSILLILFF